MSDKIKTWRKVFREFYNDNEGGGSSRWLVTPSTVEVFISGLLEKQKNELLGRSSSEDFEKFYATYPKKQGKKKAEEIWMRLRIGDELFAKIMTALEAHKKSPQWVKDGGLFIPMPQTWLYQERWNDELKVEGQGSTKYKNL